MAKHRSTHMRKKQHEKKKKKYTHTEFWTDELWGLVYDPLVLRVSEEAVLEEPLKQLDELLTLVKGLTTCFLPRLELEDEREDNDDDDDDDDDEEQDLRLTVLERFDQMTELVFFTRTNFFGVFASSVGGDIASNMAAQTETVSTHKMDTQKN